MTSSVSEKPLGPQQNAPVDAPRQASANTPKTACETTSCLPHTASSTPSEAAAPFGRSDVLVKARQAFRAGMQDAENLGGLGIGFPAGYHLGRLASVPVQAGAKLLGQDTQALGKLKDDMMLGGAAQGARICAACTKVALGPLMGTYQAVRVLTGHDQD